MPLNLSVPHIPYAHSIYGDCLVLNVYIYLNIIPQRGCQYAKTSHKFQDFWTESIRKWQSPQRHRIFPGTPPYKIKGELRVEKYRGYCFSYYDWETTCMRMSESLMVTEIKTVITWEG